MLSLASNISATQAVESKYSASFGGTDDFIDFDNVHNLGTGDFSFSFWVKASDTTTNFLFSKREDGDNYYYIRFQGSDKIQFRVKVGASEIMNLVCTTAVNAGEFNHVVMSCDRSESSTGLKYFLNGNAINSGAASATNIDNTGDFHVGRFGSDYAEDGTILDEIGIFNVALDADAASAIYNNGSPLNLRFDQGNYDNSSALQAYYRMGNGSFDDKSNGVVHDQDNPGFGSELVTNGDFSTGGVLTSTSWSLGWISSDNDGTNISGGVFNLINDAGGGFDGRATATNGVDAKISLSNSAMYVVTYTISENASNASLNFYFGEFTGGQPNTVGTHTVFHRHNPAGSNDFIVRNATNDTTIKFSNISLKKLNGNPGLTSGGVTFSSDTP
jgi:hypothetical protein